VKSVGLPRRKEPNLEDAPPEARSALGLVLVDSADEVLRVALPGAAPGLERERPTPPEARPVH
jgi:hypothetical protein